MSILDMGVLIVEDGEVSNLEYKLWEIELPGLLL